MDTPSSRHDGLVATALRLLETAGPEAVTARRVAQEYGASTMAVYSEFGSLGALADAVVLRGFGALQAELMSVGPTDDPITDIWRLALTYAGFAARHPHL